MAQYYFLVASLPFLSYENPDAVPPEVFLKTAAEHLTGTDYEILESAQLEPADGPGTDLPTLVQWNRFERGLRNELVRVRAAGLGVDPEQYVRPDMAGRQWTDESGVATVAREAVGEESPLSGEDVLGRARWARLDDLETGHFFDIDRLVIYSLKLQLLARKRLFDREGGEKAFRAATEKIMNDYYQEQGDV